LAPAGSAILNSNLAALSRIRHSMELWYTSPQRTLRDYYFYDVPHYDFSIDVIECDTTRSRDTDTLYISASVAVPGRDPVVISKPLGDHGVGFTYPNVVFRNIQLDDSEVAVFSYSIINNGHANESDIVKALESGATDAGKATANAVGNLVEKEAEKAVSEAIAAITGSAIPVVGTIVGPALGKWVTNMLNQVVPIIFANCDGPIGAAVHTVTGGDILAKMDAGQGFGQKDQNPGSDSAAGCGANSVYATTWSIKTTPK